MITAQSAKNAATFLLENLDRILLYIVGCVALGVGCYMTYEFGRAMSQAHAIGLAVLTIVAALMWAEINKLWHNQRRIIASLLGLIGIGFVTVEFLSHLGYTVGHRVRDTQETGVQNARYKMAFAEVSDGERNLTLWRDHLAKLQAEEPWVATVAAEGLRAELANLKGDYIFKRSEGCSDVTLPDSRKHCDKVAAVEQRIALAETKDDLTKKIEATQRLVSQHREQARETDFVSSPIVSQTKFVSQIRTGQIEPSEEAMTWSQITIAFVIALVTTFVPPVAFFLARAGRNTAGSVPFALPAAAPEAAPQLRLVEACTTAANTSEPAPPTLITNVLTDARMASAAASALAPFRAKALPQAA